MNRISTRIKAAIALTVLLVPGLALLAATPAYATSITIKGSMEGDMRINPGDPLKAGWDITIPGSHPAETVSVTNVKSVITANCPDGTSKTLTITMPNQTINIPADNSDWYPSGDQQSPTVWQGSLKTPTTLCGGQQAKAPAGAVFSADFAAKDTTHALHVRMHYADTGSGSWSSTNSIYPSPPPPHNLPAGGAWGALGLTLFVGAGLFTLEMRNRRISRRQVAALS